MADLTKGTWNTANLPTDLAKKSYASMFMRLFPNGPAPIWAILANMKTKQANQFEHGYYTKTMVFPSFQINNVAGYLDSSTTFTVDSTANIVPGMTFQLPRTNEIVLVLTVASATSITVRRAFGTTAAAALVDDDLFFQIGTAHEEGSSRPQAATILPTRVINFTQIFRNSWALTDSLRATMTIAGEGNVSESRQDCALFHSSDMEKALIFGEKYSGTLNNQPIRGMDGLVASIDAVAPGNTNVAGSTTTYDQLETMLDPVFTYQTDPRLGNERWLFVGGTALKVINKIGRLSGQYQIVDGQTMFGLQFQGFRLSRGTFRMVEHPLLNSNAVWSKYAIAVDFTSLALAYLADRKTKSEEFGLNGKYVESGIDAVGGSLTTEMTLEAMNPYSCGVVSNLTAAA